MIDFRHSEIDQILILFGVIVLFWSIILVALLVRHVERRETRKSDNVLSSAVSAILKRRILMD
jgi:hypothetical protein